MESALSQWGVPAHLPAVIQCNRFGDREFYLYEYEWDAPHIRLWLQDYLQVTIAAARAGGKAPCRTCAGFGQGRLHPLRKSQPQPTERPKTDGHVLEVALSLILRAWPAQRCAS